MAQVGTKRQIGVRSYRAFTIVELAVIILIIGILAGISIAAYNGWQGRVAKSVLVADLESAAAQLKSEQQWKHQFPGSEQLANDGRGLPKSAGTTYQYTRLDPPVGSAIYGYCLTAKSSREGIPSYMITHDNTVPREGVCPGDSGGTGQVANIQDVTTSNCSTGGFAVIDARDGREYRVKKLVDGHCWMLSDLAYIGGGDNSYNDTVSITEGNSQASSLASPAQYLTIPSSVGAGGNAGVSAYVYNWCAAMGAQLDNSACSGTVASSVPADSQVSICAKGWRLPTRSEYGGLLSALNVTPDTAGLQRLKTAWNTQTPGYWSARNNMPSSRFSGIGTDAMYWSSTQSKRTYIDTLSISPSRASVTVGNEMLPDQINKVSAFAVRCVAK
jgi:uncharacterized protein (TIGR02145 family)